MPLCAMCRSHGDKQFVPIGATNMIKKGEKCDLCGRGPNYKKYKLRVIKKKYIPIGRPPGDQVQNWRL